MHSEVRKFWENSGYIVDCILFEETQVIIKGLDALIYWTTYKLKNDTPHIVAATLGNGINVYWWKGKKYTEEEFLKLIRLKAFL